MRQRDIDQFGTQVNQKIQRGADGGFDADLDPLTGKILAGHTHPHALQPGAGLHLAQVVGHWNVQAGGVQWIVAGHAAQQNGGIFDAPGQGADLIQGRTVGDQPIAADTSIGRFEANHPTQGGWLTYAAASVSAEGAQHLASGHRSGAAATAAPRHALQIPRVAGGEEGRILSGGSHGKFVSVGLAQQDSPGGTQPGDRGGIERRHEALQDARSTGSGDVPGTDDVFDSNRDAE